MCLWIQSYIDTTITCQYYNIPMVYTIFWTIERLLTAEWADEFQTNEQKNRNFWIKYKIKMRRSKKIKLNDIKLLKTTIRQRWGIKVHRNLFKFFSFSLHDFLLTFFLLLLLVVRVSVGWIFIVFGGFYFFGSILSSEFDRVQCSLLFESAFVF